jgi:hypothetical protein
MKIRLVKEIGFKDGVRREIYKIFAEEDSATCFSPTHGELLHYSFNEDIAKIAYDEIIKFIQENKGKLSVTETLEEFTL